MKKRVGILLALQGDFEAHAQAITRAGGGARPRPHR